MKPGNRINPEKRRQHGKEHFSYEYIKEKHYTEKLSLCKRKLSSELYSLT